MKVSLTRFGVALETPLLAELDALVRQRGCTRSELLRDLARAEVVKSQVRDGVRAVATLTIVYDHHVRDLSERLTALQHELGEQVHSTLHVHLSHDYCLEVIVMRGLSNDLQAIAERILATRGVKHGGLEIITGVDESDAPERAKRSKRASKAATPADGHSNARRGPPAHQHSAHRHAVHEPASHEPKRRPAKRARA